MTTQEVNETREEKFDRVARKRLNRARDSLDMVLKMSTSPNYKVSEPTKLKIQEFLMGYSDAFDNAFKVKAKEDKEDVI